MVFFNILKKREENSVEPWTLEAKNGAFVGVYFYKWCISLLQSHIRDMVVLFLCMFTSWSNPRQKKPLPNFSFTKALCGVQPLDSWSSPYAWRFDWFSASKLICHKGSIHATSIFKIFKIFPSLYLKSHMQNIYPGGGQVNCLSCFPRTTPVKGSTARKCGN